MQTFADQAAIAVANARLIEAVEQQRTELARFVSPQVAELVSGRDSEHLLAGHRHLVPLLRSGLHRLCGDSGPRGAVRCPAQYHAVLGELIPAHEGTLEHFAGDGVMVFFNDPLPVAVHELKAVRFALAAQEQLGQLAGVWRKRGIELGLGIGIEAGYATIGRIGFEGRYDYGILGPVANLASRLSVEAAAGQILIGQRLFAAVEETVETAPAGDLGSRSSPARSLRTRSADFAGPCPTPSRSSRRTTSTR